MSWNTTLFRRISAVPAVLALACLGLDLGCGTTYQPPTTLPRVQKSQVVSSDIETVWRGFLRYFAEHDVPVTTLDHGGYFLRTKAPLSSMVGKRGGVQFNGDSIALENPWCDCGVAKIPNVWGTATKISVSYNLVLNKLADDQTDVALTVSFSGSYYGQRNANLPEYDIEVPLQCVSKGVLEQDVMAYVTSFK